MKTEFYCIDGMIILEIYDGDIYDYYASIPGYPFIYSFGSEKRFKRIDLYNLIRNGYFDELFD